MTPRSGNGSRWAVLGLAWCLNGCGDAISNTGSTREDRNLGQSEAGIPGDRDAATAAATSEESAAASSTADSSTEASRGETYITEDSTGGTSAGLSSSAGDSTRALDSASTTSAPPPSDTESPDEFTPVTNPPAGLTGCEEQATAAETSCVYSLRCDQRQIWTGCFAAADGTWECSCLENKSLLRMNYDVTGARPEEACAETFVMCLEGAAPPLSNPTCEFVDVAPNYYACARERQCRVSAELRPGLVVSEKARTVTTSCSYYGDGLFCRCGAGDDAIQVFQLSAEVACGAVDDYCLAPDAFTGESQCTGFSTSMSADRCAIERSCGTHVELNSSGAYAVINPIRVRATCEELGSETTCECSGSKHGSLRMVADGEELAENCRTADEVCQDQGELTLTGLLECDTLGVLAAGASCSSTSTCRLGAEVGGHPVQLAAEMMSQCSSGGPGDPWACSCSSGDVTSESFNAHGSAGFDVCSSAKDTCADMVEGYTSGVYGVSSLTFGPPPG